LTGSTLTALAANPAPSSETGLISIRFKQTFLSIRSKASALKHPLFECRMPDAGCPVFFTASSVLYCPTFSSTVSKAAASTTAAFTARDTWSLNFSSIVQLFVPLRFAIFFTQKYSALNPLMEQHLPLTGRQWALIEPFLPTPKSAATHARPSTSASSSTSW